MSNNGKSNFVIILALFIGIAGLGLGTYSTFFQSAIPGPTGEDGQDGQDGINAGGIIVGILYPDYHE